MTDTKVRIHNLAKELGVHSKAIIDKLAAEGIVVKSHMHVVSAGLEATIREWFSVGAHTTTIEEAASVDLQKVRTPRAAKKKLPSKDASAVATDVGEHAEVGDVMEHDVAVDELPHADAAAQEAAAPVEAPAPLAAEAPGPVEPAQVIVAPPVQEPPVAPPLPTTEPAAAKLAASASLPPEPVRPAGPQNVPAPAQLQGPRVIRMDRPEVVDRPRPAARPSFGGGPPAPAAPGDLRRGRVPGRGPQGEDDEAARNRARAAAAGARHRANPRRSQNDAPAVVGELLREWRDRDLIERRERLDHASGRGIAGVRADESQKGVRPGARMAPSKKGAVELTEPIIVKDFCAATGIAFPQLFRKLQELNIVATMNQALDSETAQIVAMENGLEIHIVKPKSALDRLRDEFDAQQRKHIKTRPPVVTVLGHVDHGKTSLLDRIRKANVAAGEAGGITQHIGAYRVQVKDRFVTFLDTPGHEAFTAMRARGAQMTDVVVLVVAADDGVMPQTIEAINHARAAKVPIVVALNKIDLQGADINKVYGQLAEHQLTPQEWGGETDVLKTSATTGQGVDELLSHLAALSDLMDLKADATSRASGIVVEAQRSEKHGNAARVLVQEGTLKQGSILVCGGAFGRVRAMIDDRGRKVKEAGPSVPVEVLGLDSVPDAGDRFYEVLTLAQATQVAEEVKLERRSRSIIKVAKPTTLESLLASAGEGEVPELNVIVRADVQGSVDVLRKALSEIPTEEVKLNILHAAVGNVTESDVVLAEASSAIIFGFHVVPDPAIQRLADDKGVEIRLHKIIYNVTDEIRLALEGLLEPTAKVESRGRAEVRQVFNITRVGRVAGCMVRDGTIARNHTVRLLRDGVLLKEDLSLASLKRFKDDVREVRSGFDCGIRLDGFDDLKPGDIIEAYEVVKVARKL